MDAKVTEINELLRKELSALWKKNFLDRIANTIRRSFFSLRKKKLVPSIEINVSFGPSLGSNKARHVYPLYYMTPSFTFSAEKSKELSALLGDEDALDDEKAQKLLQLHEKEAERLCKIEFSPIQVDAKIKTCSTCNGAGYVFLENS